MLHDSFGNPIPYNQFHCLSLSKGVEEATNNPCCLTSQGMVDGIATLILATSLRIMRNSCKEVLTLVCSNF